MRAIKIILLCDVEDGEEKNLYLDNNNKNIVDFFLLPLLLILFSQVGKNANQNIFILIGNETFINDFNGGKSY